jgi:glucose-6-phosphate 1-dehydrogenase
MPDMPFQFAAHTGATEPLARERRPDPCVLVIFGAAGDLTRRKLVPALYNLAREGALPEPFAVVGVSRADQDDDGYRQVLHEATSRYSRDLPLDEGVWREFAAHVHYLRASFEDPDGYVRLRDRLEELDRERGTAGNRLFYLATPPDAAPVILHRLHEASLLYEPGDGPWSRVIMEKPYGRDLESARQLNAMVADVLDESQVYRIDHYLGKETVQNILVTRFGNAIFEPLWNRKYVDHVQITASETIGVEGRGRFYENTGVIRDMVQSHLLQVLALSAMEAPVSFKADDVRDRRSEVFRALRPISGASVFENVVFGQYRGYRDEENVDRHSRTPTYVAMKVFIDNWRWQGVPFYLRVGKQMRARVTEISVHFRPIPLCLFGKEEVCERLEPNVLTIRIQPDEGICLNLVSKVPGEDLAVSRVSMDFSYAEAFDRPIKDAYERLLLDAMRGDATLFARRDGVEHAWAFVTPILEAWERSDRQPEFYAEGSDGPTAADGMLRRSGHVWQALK